MTKILNLYSSIPPSVNHYLSYRVVKTTGGKYIASSYKTNESKKFQTKFEQIVKDEVQKQGWDIESFKGKHLYVDTIFYFPKKNMDSNNYFKVLLDAITNTQLVWEDDNIVCERVSRIYYDSNNPHIEMSIHPVDYIGIFDNNEKIKDFKHRCENCSRFGRNCSVFNKALNGYIQEGVTQEDCSYFKIKKKTGEKG